MNARQISNGAYSATMVFIAIASAANLINLRDLKGDFERFEQDNHRVIQIDMVKMQSLSRMAELMESEMQLLRQRIERLEHE